jgi:hypothetical protein
MSSAHEINIQKDNFIKSKAPLYFSPDSNKKHNFTNLYTEPRNIYQERDSNLLKNPLMSKNKSNYQLQNNFEKHTKLNTDKLDKDNQDLKSNKSYQKVNSKLYLKRNIIQDISALNGANGKALLTQTNFRSNTNINNTPNDQNSKFMKSRLTNIKFNINKKNQNFYSPNNSTTYLKKNAGSAYDLLETKNLNNINHLNYIYTTGNKQNSFLSPQNHGSNPKIVYFSNKKNKTQNQFYKQNTSKELKTNQIETKDNTQSNTNSEEDKKNKINLLLKNAFTNLKIYPTTILNNKVIYNNSSTKNNQNKDIEQNQKNKKGENSNNTSKIKKEKIVIETLDKKPSITISKTEAFNSIEELHYFYVDTLQKGKNIAKELDK